MTRKTLAAAVALAAVTAAALWGSAALAQKAPDAAQRAFIERYVAAVRARKIGVLRSLYHSKAFACVNARNREAASRTLTAHVKRRISRDYTAVVYPGGAAATPKWLRLLSTSAVPVSHQIQLRYKVRGSAVVLTLPAAREGVAWRLVLLCLTERGIEWFAVAKTDPRKARRLLDKWAREDRGR